MVKKGKVRLELDALRVVTFAPAAIEEAERGTVHGREQLSGGATCLGQLTCGCACSATNGVAVCKTCGPSCYE
jgi:hypothetical protein